MAGLADIPAFATDRLSLRPLGMADAPKLQAMTDHPAITGAISFLVEPFTLEQAEALIRLGDGPDERFFGAWRRSDEELVGLVGVHLWDADTVEIGYWIGVAFQGSGYATEAAQGLIDTINQTLPDRRVVAECRPANRASWRVLEKLGFRPTGAGGLRPDRALLALQKDAPLAHIPPE